MALKKITEDLSFVSALPDTPALPTSELKKTFDKGSNVIKKYFNELIDSLFPVGSIIQNTSAEFNPTALYGGTWERIKGKVLVGVDEDDVDFASSGLSGGEKKHQLSIAEMPKHHFKINENGYCTNVSSGTGFTVPNANFTGVKAGVWTEYLGEDVPHNNLQPYETVYIWKRIG